MSQLATEIEAGGGTDEAVALALGWDTRHFPYACPNGLTWTECPRFLTDLNALAAECERRGLVFQSIGAFGNHSASIMPEKGGPRFDGSSSTLCRALCAALAAAAKWEGK